MWNDNSNANGINLENKTSVSTLIVHNLWKLFIINVYMLSNMFFSIVFPNIRESFSGWSRKHVMYFCKQVLFYLNNWTYYTICIVMRWVLTTVPSGNSNANGINLENKTSVSTLCSNGNVWPFTKLFMELYINIWNRTLLHYLFYSRQNLSILWPYKGWNSYFDSRLNISGKKNPKNIRNNFDAILQLFSKHAYLNH
jgi:hypothetical protein